MVREVAGWLEQRLPAGWFTGPPEVTVDDEEFVLVREENVLGILD